MTNQCFFLEGLPGTGKTTLSNELRKDILSVDEILTPEKLAQYHNTKNQSYFLSNDENKIRFALESDKSCFIDRGPLSTLLFNLCKCIVDEKHDPTEVVSWYKNTITPLIFNGEKKFKFIVIDIPPDISLSRKSRSINQNDPWADPISLGLIREMYVAFAKKHSDVSLLIDGSQSVEDILEKIKRYVQHI